eukprot:Skav217167  [mRNA]  locus=scaffold566:266929:269120:+ [translate_table: standard]
MQCGASMINTQEVSRDQNRAGRRVPRIPPGLSISRTTVSWPDAASPTDGSSAAMILCKAHRVDRAGRGQVGTREVLSKISWSDAGDQLGADDKGPKRSDSQLDL